MAGVVFKRHFLDDCVAIFNLEKKHETAQDILGSYIFFFSSLAVNALWHGPDNDISGEKGGTQLNWPVPVKGQIITQNRKNTDKDDPQIPQPDLRFVSKATKQQDERGQAQQKTPKNDLP